MDAQSGSNGATKERDQIELQRQGVAANREAIEAKQAAADAELRRLDEVSRPFL